MIQVILAATAGDGKQKGVGFKPISLTICRHIVKDDPIKEREQLNHPWGTGCFAHDRHQSLFKSKSFWNNYGTVSSTE